MSAWLTVVGLGADGPDGLPPAMRAVIENAEILVGGERHLGLVANGHCEKVSWGFPLDTTMETIVANRGKRFDHAHEDVYVAIRDAFNAVRRKLKDDTRIRRGNTKAHADPFLGTVVKLLPDHGFAETAQGEVYFHREAVAGGGFEGLEAGTRVRLVLAENESEHGLQASTVTRWSHEAP